MKEVRSIPYEQVKGWFLKKHYAKRVPGSVMFSFGLYDSGRLIGVLSYGMPPNSKMNEMGGRRILELNRLVLLDNKKNEASYFVARTYKYLQDFILLSYADDTQGHRGYLYQALNWIYTGETAGGEILETKSGLVHKRAYDQRDKKDTVIGKTKGKKHRYFYLPKRSKLIRKIITDRFPECPYPKGDNIKYDSGEELSTQSFLF